MISSMYSSIGVGATVQTAELDDDAVTTAKITDDAVTTAKITDLNVTTAKIAADAVTAAKIADDAVGSEHIEDLSANLTLADELNIVVNTTTGTNIGTATSQKLGFFNATPVVQANHIANPDQTGDAAADVAANASAINAILVVLENLGLTASS